MGTRSLVSTTGKPHSDESEHHRMGFGHLEVKKEFQIKKEVSDDEIKEYAETAMNELLGWYGYDKVDSRDTQGLNLHHFSAAKVIASTRMFSSEGDSSDPEGMKNSESPGKSKGSICGSPSISDSSTATPADCTVCSWCNKIISHKMFSMNTPMGEKSFCSETCFSQCRRANFKRNKTCDWCRHIRHTVNYVDFQDGELQLQFCSDKCLNQYKMNIFCKETEAHLQLHPHLQGLGTGDNGSGKASVRLITPELWLRDCRSVSPSSDRSVSPLGTSPTPLEIKVVMRSESQILQPPAVKPPTSSIQITKIERKNFNRDRSRRSDSLDKSLRQNRSAPIVGHRRSSSSSRNRMTFTSPKPAMFPPPLLPLNGNSMQHLPSHAIFPPSHNLSRPPLMSPLGCFPPSHSSIANPSCNTSQVLRPQGISQSNPFSQTVINKNQKNRIIPPPRGFLPPVTVLVPYPVALAIPIPLPIPIPIPLSLLKKENLKTSDADEAPRAFQGGTSPDASSTAASANRPLRKRKRDSEMSPEEYNSPQRKTVPV